MSITKQAMRRRTQARNKRLGPKLGRPVTKKTKGTVK